MWRVIIVMFSAAALCAAGCQKAPDKGSDSAANAAAAKASQHVLAAEPAGAKTVREVRQSAKDKEPVTMVGRIGGTAKPFVDGIAAFTVMDVALKPCEDACPTPWDCCCDDPKELRAGTATVKIVDAAGLPVAADARKLLAVKELSTVVIRGKAQRDEAGNLTVLADGVYVRK
jgi:hypothetical protein